MIDRGVGSNYPLQVQVQARKIAASMRSNFLRQPRDVHPNTYVFQETHRVFDATTEPKANAPPCWHEPLAKLRMLSAEAQSVCYALIIQVPLLLFHISVDICILRQLLRRNVAFSKGFYTLYLCQSLSDTGNFLVPARCSLPKTP